VAQKHNTSGYPAPALTMDGDDYFAGNHNGVLTALTNHSGAPDPSSGAPVAWGADEVGRVWLDTTDPANPVFKLWQQLSGTPTYGWRTLRYLKTKWLTAPQAVTFSPASPAAADVAATDVDLTTLLDGAGVQDTSQTAPVVKGVWLRVRVRTGASETITAATDHAYFQLNEKSSTVVQRLYCQVANRYVERTVFVPLDSGEIFQFLVKVGGGTPAFEYEAWVVGLVEAL
jgi:hypothetical protein